MLRLVVRLVVNRVDAGEESILVEVRSDHFSPDQLDVLISNCLSMGLEAAGGEARMLQSWNPEMSVVLTSEEGDSVRPSLHLNITTIQRLADIGASFDFDPYV